MRPAGVQVTKLQLDKEELLRELEHKTAETDRLQVLWFEAGWFCCSAACTAWSSQVLTCAAAAPMPCVGAPGAGGGGQPAAGPVWPRGTAAAARRLGGRAGQAAGPGGLPAAAAGPPARQAPRGGLLRLRRGPPKRLSACRRARDARDTTARVCPFPPCCTRAEPVWARAAAGGGPGVGERLAPGRRHWRRRRQHGAGHQRVGPGPAAGLALHHGAPGALHHRGVGGHGGGRQRLAAAAARCGGGAAAAACRRAPAVVRQRGGRWQPPNAEPGTAGRGGPAPRGVARCGWGARSARALGNGSR